ncbi:hypothetical protein Ple7327_0156 [Pleurocapsa sp. PCC 7327]|uniref:hypothetical protein n=1 Tax=Pleurocapsa sp. PCC 7327 TaxID=118163 RepID=UPI00029FC9FC|nr:hypothetical protein [Pleurocapsa sp. PCC 7327]AFY75635.1 hypothetical protein Ple7327_0156 [Pleurocapsa sp. PCC 7327]
MPSSAPGPYKSRLFNFLNRHSLQFKDRLEKTARHLKVALEWGVQILIYPMYLLVQTGRMAGRQLGKTVEKAQLPASSSPTETQPTSPPADQPIAQVLQAIEVAIAPESSSNPSPQETELLAGIQQQTQSTLKTSDLLRSRSTQNLTVRSSSETAKSSQIVVRGIASSLQTRDLVLVTSDNQILDIFSGEQQKTLQKCIYWEVANFWYERRLQQEAANPFPELVSSFEQNSDNVLPPARLFWKVMHWMQTSPIAIAIDLFGESHLVRSPSADAILSSSEPQTVRDRSVGWLQRLQTGLNFSQKSSQQPATSEPDPFQIQALIQAAIDYFFGQRQEQLPLSGDKALKASPAEIEDPWLSWDDLYSETETVSTSDRTSHPDGSIPTQLPPPSAKPVKSKKSPSTLRRSSRDRQAKPAVRHQNVTEVKQPSSIVPNQPTDNSLELDPDWIETKATPVGYVKHPLERILEWLDRLLLLAEEWVASIWRWLRQRF